jgi:hypothetical protein
MLRGHSEQHFIWREFMKFALRLIFFLIIGITLAYMGYFAWEDWEFWVIILSAATASILD